MTEKIMYLLSNAFHIYALYVFSTVFLHESRCSKKIIFAAYCGYYAVNSAAYLLFASPILNLTTNILPFLAITFLYKSRISRKFAATVMIYAVGMFWDGMIYSLSNALGIDTIIVSGGFAAALMLYVTGLAVRSITKKQKITDIGLNIVYYFSIIFIPVGSIVIGYFSMQKWDVTSIIITFFLLAVNILVFYLYDGLLSACNEHYEKENLRQCNEYYRHELDILEQSQTRIRCLRHDMNNHLYRVAELCRMKRYDDLESYVAGASQFASTEGQFVSSGNPEVDCLLNYKLGIADSAGIECETKIELPDELFVSAFDINVILGNLLDNAIEALAVFDGEKKLSLSLLYKQNTILILIRNTYSQNKSNPKKTTKNDTENHGLGLKSVGYALQKYNGILELNSDEIWFSARAVLYNN